MIYALCLLIGLQLAGTAFAGLLGLPVPGPVIGLLVLLVWLLAGGRRPAGLEAAAEGFIRYLPLLFVPAAVGLVQYLDLLSKQGLVLIVVIVLSTLAGLLATALMFTIVAGWLSPPDRSEKRQI
ncbi:MAG: CidA/LrgA family protein [Candidatus Puniceispirillaceae bacterium]